MKFFRSPYYNAALNLAIEETLLKDTNEEFVLLYVNSPSVIVGKHQNSLAEVNYYEVIEKNIPLIRRISGGGTVYHDYGNINFSFILNAPGNNKVDFRKYTAPVLQFLESLSLPVSFGKRNELLLDGKKISGNAEHVHKNRVLHHGTLLFDSDLDVLQNTLKVDLLSYKDKSSKSVRSVVCNIKDYLDGVNIDSFIQKFENWLLHTLSATKSELTSEQINSADNLAEQKYRTTEWNFAYNPKYFLEKLNYYNMVPIQVFLSVEKGKILLAKLSSESRDNGIREILTMDFKNVFHDFLSIKNHLKTNEFFIDMDEHFVNSYVKLFF